MSESAPPPTSPGSTTSPPPAAASTKTPPPPGDPAASNSPPPSSSSSPPAPPESTPPPAGKAPPPAAEPPPTPPSDPEQSPPPPIPTASTPPPSPPAQPAIPVPPPPLANPTPPLSPPPPSPPVVLPLPPPASPSGANASPPPLVIAVPTAPTGPIDTPTPPSSKPASPPPPASVVTPPSSPNTTKSPSNPTPEPSNSTRRPIPATPVPRNASTSADASSSSNLAPVRPSSQSSPPASSRDSSGTGVVVGLAAVAAVALAVFVFLFLKRKKRNGDFSKGHKHSLNGFSPKNRKRGPAAAAAPNTEEKSYRIYVGDVLDSGVSKPLFTYEELTSITNGFSPDNVIGEGGFGAVYKGVLPDGRQVAVKQLKPGSGQGEREFRAEVEIISRIHHRHLVSLVGYCTELQRLLVYEFVANNTLDHHLHVKGLPVLDWSNRMKIAIGSARGLAYLHEDCNPRIIHRDIKSANILLDESFEAKVADFGLAKLTNDTSTHISTRVMGTFGYLAPEYAFSGKLTDRSDVYSFGVVLLELVTGRKPVDPSLPSGDGSLVEWARPLLVHALETGECEHLVDPRLENNYVKKDMLRAIEVATACVRHSAPKRPRMVQVLRALDSRGSIPDLSNGVKFGESTVYNSSQYSADIQQLRRMAFQRDTFTIDFENSGAQGHGSSSTAYSAAMDGRGGN